MTAGRLGIILLLAATAAAPAMAQSTIFDAVPVNPGTQMRSVQLARLLVNIRHGEKIGTAKLGMLCIPRESLNWRTGAADVKDAVFEQVFREKFKELGLPIADDPSNLFGTAEDRRADFLVGGAINRISLEPCFKSIPLSNVVDLEMTRGSAAVDVEWQIFSQLDRKVVAKVRVIGTAKRSSFGRGGGYAMMFEAFGDAAAQLARNPQFLQAVSGPPTVASALRAAPQSLVPIQMTSAPPGPASLPEVVAATAVIFSPGGHGSGVLISPDGLLLTNQHVVGGSPYVKVRWADGVELLGEVLRSDKIRDVALIKTDAKGRKALAIRPQSLAIGEDIYAVGAPADPKLQSTVTKGIVSAKRVMEGLNFIQGDVAVTHGNSGGPIVDAKGQVVGLTVAGLPDATMVNYFIPIDDALSFLGMQMMAPPPGPASAKPKPKR